MAQGFSCPKNLAKHEDATGAKLGDVMEIGAEALSAQRPA